jgi:NAD(P)H-flavin reductase/formate hydrogenlyase subunit 6/NADH:ubiquinone oxidoreductase subunit I
MKIISKQDFLKFVNSLINDGSWDVVGVKSRGNKYAFDSLESADELRLSYDTTILPPKKYFYPQRETLIQFDTAKGGFTESSTDIKPRIIMGISPYDIAALLQLDEVFKESKADPYYAEKRDASIIIGINIQTMTEWNFSAVMGSATVNQGYDLMLTDLGDKYAIDVGSDKGKQLLSGYAKNVRDAYANEVQLVERKKLEIINMSQQKLDFSPDLIPELLNQNYANVPFWEKHSEKCLACGSCVMVCPTCYCFDIKESPILSLDRGERIRTWDACLLEGFAKVASGEDFRPTLSARYRHRYFKKGQYLFNRFGFISCVGCGRCSSNCLPDIANPVKLFNDMYQENVKTGIEITSPAPPEISITTEEKIDFVPKLATIVKKIPMTASETFFEVQFNDGSDLEYTPGQFIEVSVFGVGEAPISVSSSPTKNGTFEICVRRIGNVTTKLTGLNEGDIIGIRGPFGIGFDTDFLQGKDLLFIAGGLGIAPLRSLFNYVLDKRSEFGKVTMLYGCKEPCELLFSEEVESWSKRDDIEHKLTVDKCPESEFWEGNIGVITTLIPEVDFDPVKTYAVVCGPPVMYKYVIQELKKRNLPDDHITISLERRMRCGVGKCGHCQINQIYVCKEGPVFNYADIKDVPEAL